MYDWEYPMIPCRRRGKRHHHGGDVCGIVVVLGLKGFSILFFCRNPTWQDFFIPAQTLIGVKLLTPQLSVQSFDLGASHHIDVSYPYCYYLGQLEPFFNNLTTKYPKIRGRHVRLMILERVLAQWQRLVAFRKDLDLLHWAMSAV